ncbi:NAD-dependent epimerase/dehydratase family protein [Pedobacter sp. L105]|uniref:NAD-dependent epimerase/dehydratase family protein n=1 Tax=Pedobacter sp. L105 TaxID=1641871 RepID=UPI00131B84DD|nr:NAD-dependent epimerase/dehydratase family protein [Pedobacter sp. L105]
MKLHTILGSNGTIAKELVPILKSNQVNIRLVSRNQGPVEGAESMVADVLNYDQVLKAVAGSEAVYLLVGLTYNADIWKKDWPVLMRNVINACKATNARLVFFDGIYMYGKVDGVITEDTPYYPSSRKGQVRAEVARMLLQEMAAGTIKAVIARATDFYGPGVTDKSAAGILVFDNMKKGKRAQWMINANVPRSYNYTPNAAKALYILASHEEAFGQVWHLPSASPLTGREFIRLAAKYMKTSDKVFVLPKWCIKIIGWFNPFMKSYYEMTYQDEFPLQLSSAKFEKAFHFTPTSYEDGVKATADWYLAN